MKCKFDHEGDCCNCGSNQYMAKCKPKTCNCPVPITNADRIRYMTDEELCDFMMYDHPCDTERLKICNFDCPECIMGWLKQPAEEKSHDETYPI